jgi:ABC-type branched-subunit amino acid transport system ATPase component
VNLVNLEKVVKGYGQRLLLNGASAGVAAGERVGVVGRNGAGKSRGVTDESANDADLYAVLPASSEADMTTTRAAKGIYSRFSLASISVTIGHTYTRAVLVAASCWAARELGLQSGKATPLAVRS